MTPTDKHEIIKALASCKSKKLRLRIFQLLKVLSLHGKNLRVQQSVEQFYYMQKQQELETLEERLSESLQQSMIYLNRLEQTYDHVSARWKKDYVNLKRIVGKMNFNTNMLKEGKVQDLEPCLNAKCASSNFEPLTSNL